MEATGSIAAQDDITNITTTDNNNNEDGQRDRELRVARCLDVDEDGGGDGGRPHQWSHWPQWHQCAAFHHGLA